MCQAQGFRLSTPAVAPRRIAFCILIPLHDHFPVNLGHPDVVVCSAQDGKKLLLRETSDQAKGLYLFYLDMWAMRQPSVDSNPSQIVATVIFAITLLP